MSTRDTPYLILILIGAFLIAAAGCGKAGDGKTSAAVSCTACGPAFDGCEGEGTACADQASSCFATCDAPDGAACGCTSLYDACIAAAVPDHGDGDGGPDGPDAPDGRDAGPDDGGGDGDPVDAGPAGLIAVDQETAFWACEQAYQICAVACGEDVAASPCPTCAALPASCRDEARAADDPAPVLAGCKGEMASCFGACVTGDDPCAACQVAYETCEGEATDDAARVACGDALVMCLEGCQPQPTGCATTCNDAYGTCVAAGTAEADCFATWQGCATGCTDCTACEVPSAHCHAGDDTPETCRAADEACQEACGGDDGGDGGAGAIECYGGFVACLIGLQPRAECEAMLAACGT